MMIEILLLIYYCIIDTIGNINGLSHANGSIYIYCLFIYGKL